MPDDNDNVMSNDTLVSIILAIGFFGIVGYALVGYALVGYAFGHPLGDFLPNGIVGIVVGIVRYLAYDVSVSFDIVSTFSAAYAALVVAALGAFYGSNVSSDLGGRSSNN